MPKKTKPSPAKPSSPDKPKPTRVPIRSQQEVGFPISFKRDQKPFQIEPKDGFVLVISDIHAPYHCRRSLDTVVSYCQPYEPHTVINLGDMVEFHHLSRHDHDAGKVSTQEEINAGIAIFRTFKHAFPKADHHFKPGNHDLRLYSYIQKNCPALIGQLNLPEMFKVNEMGIGYVDDNETIKIGDIALIHGHEFGKESGYASKNPAEKFFKQFNDNVLGAHHHRTNNFWQRRSRSSDWFHAHSLGCLCDLTPDWMPNNQWNNGFALIEFNKGKSFVYNLRIYDGRVV